MKPQAFPSTSNLIIRSLVTTMCW